VIYTRGLGIDQPLSAVRKGYGDHVYGDTYRIWTPFAVLPLWDPEGGAPYAVFADGKRERCLPNSTRCLGTWWQLAWLPYAGDKKAFVISGGIDGERVWLGNVMDDLQDASGLLYRRNRYYDPATGQFTQEDPIGLAGGMNLYGFAGGDPVNFSDPFGLCPPQITGRPCSGWVATGVGFVPLLGDAIDVAGALKGRDLLTGERIGNVGAGVAIIGTIFGSGRLAREGGDALIKGAERIQRFANKHGVEVSVVGSRASGTAGAASDYDYVITGGNAKVRAAARRELPRGQAGGELDASGRGTGNDVFNGNVEPLDRSRPHVIFRPNP
jgi:RHS repeat-associated protein